MGNEPLGYFVWLRIIFNGKLPEGMQRGVCVVCVCVSWVSPCNERRQIINSLPEKEIENKFHSRKLRKSIFRFVLFCFFLCINCNLRGRSEINIVALKKNRNFIRIVWPFLSQILYKIAAQPYGVKRNKKFKFKNLLWCLFPNDGNFRCRRARDVDDWNET